MSRRNKLIKRTFDLVGSLLGITFLWPLILVSWVIASLDTKAPGLFRQTRVGQNGELFSVNKLRTMKPVGGTTVTTINDVRITKWGARFRRLKIDELPQLWNVLIGQMSFVGPRPDMPGYLDKLSGDDRRLLDLKPGITGPATLKYRNEEELLAQQKDPVAYNDSVIWPDKVRINLEYLDNWSLSKDIMYILRTIKK